MHERASPSFTGEVGRNGDVAIGEAEIERVLEDFREWLTRLPSRPPAPVLPEPIDLATVVRHFVALRQEVNLQTRAGRAHLDQNAHALDKLGQSVDLLRAAAEEPEEDDGSSLRPILKALVEARDALALAEKHVVKTRESLEPPAPPPPVGEVSLPIWARWFGWDAKLREAAAPLKAWADAQIAASSHAAMIDSLAVGYAMSRQRLDRALEQQGLERIDCVGRPFDPEFMEVVEIVRDASRTGSEVLEETRPGYLFRGHVFRCAQVRVARP